MNFINHEEHDPHAGGLGREGFRDAEKRRRTLIDSFWDEKPPLRAVGEVGSVSRGFVLRC